MTHVHTYALGSMALYGVGMFLHILMVANLAVHSKGGAINDFKTYLSTRWIPISCRIFLSILAFVLLWDNPALFDIDRFMTTASSQVAISGVLGWFSDSLLDKLISFVPWLKKELPVVPAPGDSGKTPNP